MKTVYKEIDQTISAIQQFNESNRIMDTPNPHALDPSINEINRSILANLSSRLTGWSEVVYDSPSRDTREVTRRLRQIVSNLDRIIENPGSTRDEMIRKLESLKKEN